MNEIYAQSRRHLNYLSIIPNDLRYQFRADTPVVKRRNISQTRACGFVACPINAIPVIH